jgi:hypothetical protein
MAQTIDNDHLCQSDRMSRSRCERTGVRDIASNKSTIVISRLCLALFVLAPAVLGLGGIADHARAAEAIKPIQFSRGASSAEVKGAVIRGERALYSFVARGGQHASLRISALEDNAIFQLYAPGAKPEMRDSVLEILGDALPGAAEGEDAVRWEGALPDSGAYLLVVGPTRGNAEYRLTVTIR